MIIELDLMKRLCSLSSNKDSDGRAIPLLNKYMNIKYELNQNYLKLSTSEEAGVVEALQWAAQQTPEQSHSKKCQIIIAPAWIWLDDTSQLVAKQLRSEPLMVKQLILIS